MPQPSPSYPPPSSPPAATAAYTTTAPPASHPEDSGRGLEFFYARAGARGALLATQAFGTGELRFKDPTGLGGAFDLAAGVRLLFVTIGPRARALVLSNATLFQVGAEAAMHVPLGRLDPFVGIEGGYTFGSHAKDDFDYPCFSKAIGAAAPDPCTQPGPSLSVHGADVGLTGGLDYYLSPGVSVGAAASLSILFLSREAMPWAIGPDSAGQASGGSTGLGVTLGPHAAFHL